jgi:hypothetical protein
LSPRHPQLDRRLAEYDGLSVDEAAFRVILETNREPAAGEERSRLLLEALTRSIGTHGWEVSRLPPQAAGKPRRS